MIKKILITLLLLALPVAWLINYMFNKPHKDIRDEVTISISAPALFNEFETDEVAANTKYLNKALKVNGTVAIIEENQDMQTYLVLKTDDDLYGIMCTMSHQDRAIKVGDKVSVKGYCSGFVGDVKLTDCIIENNP